MHNISIHHIFKHCSDAFDWIAPRCCLVCQCIIANDELLCSSCSPQKSLAIIHSSESCAVCGEKMACGVCPLCALTPLPINAMRSAWLYEAEIEAIVKCYKYKGRTALAKWMAKQMQVAINSFAHNNWDLMLPTPSTWQHIRARGYIHLLPLCRILSRQYQLSLVVNALISTKERPTQTQGTLKRRFINVSGGFSCDTRVVYGKKVLLVDDVITTGATVSEAAKSILSAGATQIDVLSFARSSRFRHNRIASMPKNEEFRNISQVVAV